MAFIDFKNMEKFKLNASGFLSRGYFVDNKFPKR